MVGIHYFDSDLMWAKRLPREVDRISVTRVRKKPRQIVDMDIQMPDTWRDSTIRLGSVVYFVGTRAGVFSVARHRGRRSFRASANACRTPTLSNSLS